MNWTEPKYSASRRSSLFIFPVISVFVAMISFISIALIARLISGNWELEISIIGGMAAGVIDYLSRRKHLSMRQEIEIGLEVVEIKGHTNHRIEYGAVRGYSIIDSETNGNVVRHLLIYPSSEGIFSIGIPNEITNENIVRALPTKLKFVTYIDDSATRNPYA